jgi:3-hydroxyisobutyrate dehydrogenase-like beta-hydroxyacid dehydrogenase
MKVGFIGLGHMGSAMAKNLVIAGNDVTVFNRTPGRSRALRSQTPYWDKAACWQIFPAVRSIFR